MTSPADDLGSPPVTLTWDGFRRGAHTVTPLIPGMLIFGMLCGVVARQAGLTFVENLLMNVLVFAGAGQLAALDQWATPLPVLGIVMTTLLVNMRFLLHGIAVHPWLRTVDPKIVYRSLWSVNDQSWSIAMVAYGRGERDAGFYFGANLIVVPFWVLAAAAGYLVGSGLGDPARIGVDFSVTVIFAANLAATWRGRHDALPWIAAATASLLAAWVIPGTWYILIGGVTGFLVAVFKTPAPPVIVATSEVSR